MANTATLRTVGGSVMMAIPKALLESLGVAANAKLDLAVEDGKLVAIPRKRPRYTLDELLDMGDPNADLTQEDLDWLSDPPKGNEVI